MVLLYPIYSVFKIGDTGIIVSELLPWSKIRLLYLILCIRSFCCIPIIDIRRYHPLFFQDVSTIQ